MQKSINLLNEPGALSGVPVVGGVLQSASDYLGLGKTGALTNLIPEKAQPMFNEKGLIARDTIRSAVQESLKAVLGTQFAAVEGENLMGPCLLDVAQPEGKRRPRQYYHDPTEQYGKE